MKANIVKRMLLLGLSGLMLLSLTACGEKKETNEETEKKVVIEDMELETVYSKSFDFIGGPDVMPIGGYYGPAADIEAGDGRKLLDHYTDEVFSKIAETGVNLVLYPNADYKDMKKYVIKQLELGEKYNLGFYIYDQVVCEPNPNSPISIEELDKRIAEYCDYPAFCGVYVIDEPQDETSGIVDKHLSKFVDVYQKLAKLGVTGSVNLGPIKKGSEAEYQSYREFVERLCSTCYPQYLCFDYYVWDGDTTTEGYFYNMSIIREMAEKYNIPWWSFIQAGGSWNDGGARFDSEPYVHEGRFQWNVNTTLACGAKGISYFPMIQPSKFAWALSEEFDFQRNGLLGAYGNKTQWWYYAQTANKQITAVDSVLMNAVNKGIIVTGKQAKQDTANFAFVMEGDSWRELKSVEGNTLIGCFNYNGKTALYVTNYESEYAQKITLNLQDTYKMTITHNAKEKNVKTDKLVLDMMAGEGALIVFN